MRTRLLEPWRTRLLWLSLGLNLFALAALAAPPLWHHHPPGPPSFDAIVARMARDLGPADGEAFRAQMAHERPWYELGRQRQNETREQFARALRAEPFDPAAVSAALAGIQESMQSSAQRFNESLVGALATLPPDGRARMAESLQRRRP